MELGMVVNNLGKPTPIQIISNKRQILTVFIAFISIISISYYPKYVHPGIEDVWNYFFPMKNDPIFCDLANSTTTLIEDLVRFNIPASTDVMELRKTSNFLSDIISRSQTSDSSSALYLQSLGDKAYIAGTQIEKLYSAGSFSLDELSKELQDTRQYLLRPSNDSLLTEKGAQYCCARFDQIHDLMARFRGKFVDIERTVQEIQKLYRGYDNIQGFPDIIKHFDDNDSAYKQIYNMKMIRQKLDLEREKINKLLVIDRELIRVGESLDLFNKKLDSFKERIIYLSDKKILTQEDDQVLEEVIDTVNTAKETWHRMDKVDNDHFLIEG